MLFCAIAPSPPSEYGLVLNYWCYNTIKSVLRDHSYKRPPCHERPHSSGRKSYRVSETEPVTRPPDHMHASSKPHVPCCKKGFTLIRNLGASIDNTHNDKTTPSKTIQYDMLSLVLPASQCVLCLHSSCLRLLDIHRQVATFTSGRTRNVPT